MTYKLDIEFTEEERITLTTLYGAEAIEKYIHDLDRTIETSFKILIDTNFAKVVTGVGDINWLKKERKN